jgi:nitrogen regulatory protein PII
VLVGGTSDASVVADRGEAMRLVKSNVCQGRIDEVKNGLMALGVQRIRVAQITGYVEGSQAEIIWRGCRSGTHLLPEYEIEALVCDESVDQVVELIIKTVRQSSRADGFVCVTSVEQCYRIRTGNPES